MPIKDNRSDFEPILVQTDIISTDTTTDGSSFDTRNFEAGVTFVFLATAYTDGTYTPVLEESATGAFTGEENVIADANLIGTETGAAISAAISEGDVLNSIGIFSTKQFVRSTIVSTSTSTGATISTIVIAGPELVPSPNLSA